MERIFLNYNPHKIITFIFVVTLTFTVTSPIIMIVGKFAHNYYYRNHHHLRTISNNVTPYQPMTIIQGLSNRPLWTGGATILESTFEVRAELQRGAMLAEIDKHLKEDINYMRSSLSPSPLPSTSFNFQNKNRSGGHHFDYFKLSTSLIFFSGWNDESCFRLRALLERVLSLHQSHSLFWILYVHLECFSMRFLEGKKVFFRAINSVGFCKNVWLLLFGPLGLAFTEEELNDLKSVMIEEKNLLWRSS